MDNTEIIETILECGKTGMTVSETCRIIEISEDVFKHNNEFLETYDRGRIEQKFKVRKSVIKMAQEGVPQMVKTFESYGVDENLKQIQNEQRERKKYNKAEFAELTKLSYPQIRKLLDKGSFYLDGFGEFIATKTGDSKTSPFVIEQIIDETSSDTVKAVSTESTVKKLNLLKARKLKAQTELLELQKREKIEEIENEILNEFIPAVKEILSGLTEAITRCKLNAEQNKILKAAVRESILQLTELQKI